MLHLIYHNICQYYYKAIQDNRDNSQSVHIEFDIFHYLLLSKEVGKQYFRVTNDFYLVQLTMMKGGRSCNNT